MSGAGRTRCDRRVAARDRLRCDRGTSTVELALLAPVVALLLGALIWVGEVGVVRLRQRELVRFAAFEMGAHPLSDEWEARHRERWERAHRRAMAEVARHYGAAEERPGGVEGPGDLPLVGGMLASGRIRSLTLEPLALSSDRSIRSPSPPGGFGAVIDRLGSALRAAGRLQREAWRRGGFSVDQIGVVAEARVAVENSGLLPWLPGTFELAPASLELQLDTWSLDDGADVPLPGRDTAFGRQVGRLALLGVGERLRSSRAAEALRWLPVQLEPAVVSMNYGSADPSPVRCGGDDPLARSGRWENGEAWGTRRDDMSPVRCFDTLPIEANGFGAGGGREGDPLWRMLRSRGPHFMGCDRKGAKWPNECGTEERRWAGGFRR